MFLNQNNDQMKNQKKISKRPEKQRRFREKQKSQAKK